MKRWLVTALSIFGVGICLGFMGCNPIIETSLKNPSWSELQTFLFNDKTDQIEYSYPSFVCDDYARTLQEQANKAGWKCGFVIIELNGYIDRYGYGIASNTEHSLNVFETTDKGMIYIDCTGLPSNYYDISNCDKIVNVVVGEEYIAMRIFSEYGWSDVWENMGTIVDVKVKRW